MNNEPMNAAWMTADPSANGGNPNKNKKNSNAKQTVTIALSVAAAVLALGAGGFAVYGMMSNGGQNGGGLFNVATEPTKEFTFDADTKVSGVDISGKTVQEAKAYLESNKSNLVKPVLLSVKIGEEEVELNQDSFDYSFNIGEVVDQAKADADKKLSTSLQTYTVEANVKEASIEANVAKLCKEYNAEPVDARVTEFYPYAKNRFAYQESKAGFTVDSESLQEQIKEALLSGNNLVTIEAETTAIEPDVTTDYLRKNIVKLASYQTYSTNTDNATSNMKVSLKACSGSIIEPWETWSFNECTGDSNLESNGYKTAHVISQGKLVDGIGGGICQSSSTIYNAAIRANMKIEERYNHKWASSYVPTGLDATIDYPNLDLKLSNPTNYQMFLECKVEGSTLYASFWGVKTGDYDEIKTRNEQGEKGKESYEVKAWRVYYKDGKKVSEEELFESSYDLEHGVVFYSADNDEGAKDTNVDEPDKIGATEPTKPTDPPATTEPAKATEATAAAEPTTKKSSSTI